MIFQYIPCYCLSFIVLFFLFTMFISIHPMLLFITEEEYAYITQKQISIHPMLLFILYDRDAMGVTITFQYIPCYCLSTARVETSTSMGWFQYIPCYCLSASRTNTSFNARISIHPMLLFIFSNAWRNPKIRWISIHPMLLFIYLWI